MRRRVPHQLKVFCYSILVAAVAWVFAGFAVGLLDMLRHGYTEDGRLYLLLWNTANVYSSLVLRFLIAGVVLGSVLLLLLRVRSGLRIRILFLILAVTGFTALLWFGYDLNRYGFIEFWKHVRNTRSLPGVAGTVSLIAANAGLVLMVGLMTGLLFRVSRHLVYSNENAIVNNRIRNSMISIILFPLLLFAGTSVFQPEPPTGMNVLLIALDTVRQDHLTLCGYPKETTPNLSALSMKGTLFINTISQAPWTLSSFASLMTGLYPSTHGACIQSEERNLSRNYIPFLDKRVTLLSEIFKEHGYRTMCEASNTYLRFGLEQGYDHSRVEIRSAGDVADAAIQWLSGSADRPFFAFLHFNDAHIPNSPPAPFDQMFRASDGRPHSNEEKWKMLYTDGTNLRNPDFLAFREHRIGVYDGCIRYIDSQIGKVLSWIDQQKLSENTIIVVITDHGEEFWDHAEMEKENYLDPRGFYGVGHGHTLFSEQLRILMLLKGPTLRGNRVIPTVVRAIDMAPTLLELAGIESPRTMEGLSLLPILRGEEMNDRPVIAEAIVFGSDRKMIFRDGFKLICSPDEPDMLFDLSRDPGERRNILESSPQIASRLFDDLDLWLDGRSGRINQRKKSIDEETLEELRALGYIQ